MVISNHLVLGLWTFAKCWLFGGELPTKVFHDIYHVYANYFGIHGVSFFQRVCVNLHWLFGFISKLQSTLIESFLHRIPETSTTR